MWEGRCPGRVKGPQRNKGKWQVVRCTVLSSRDTQPGSSSLLGAMGLGPECLRTLSQSWDKQPRVPMPLLEGVMVGVTGRKQEETHTYEAPTVCRGGSVPSSVWAQGGAEPSPGPWGAHRLVEHSVQRGVTLLSTAGKALKVQEGWELPTGKSQEGFLEGVVFGLGEKVGGGCQGERGWCPVGSELGSGAGENLLEPALPCSWDGCPASEGQLEGSYCLCVRQGLSYSEGSGPGHTPGLCDHSKPLALSASVSSFVQRGMPTPAPPAVHWLSIAVFMLPNPQPQHGMAPQGAAGKRAHSHVGGTGRNGFFPTVSHPPSSQHGPVLVAIAKGANPRATSAGIPQARVSHRAELRGKAWTGHPSPGARGQGCRHRGQRWGWGL